MFVIMYSETCFKQPYTGNTLVSVDRRKLNIGQNSNWSFLHYLWTNICLKGLVFQGFAYYRFYSLYYTCCRPEARHFCSLLTHCSLGYKMAPMKNLSAWTWKSLVLQYFSKVLEADRLEPRSGSTYVGPDLGSSLLAIVQKYWYISIPSVMC